MPKRAIAFILGIVAFGVAVLSIAAWAKFSGAAGSQRGLVIHTQLPSDAIVTLEDGQSARLGPGGDSEHTFVVKRQHFPATIAVTDPGGRLIFDKRFEYGDLVKAEFRISFDRNGFYATQELRDTPVPTP